MFPSFSINKRIFVHDGPAEELNCDVIVIAATPNLAVKGGESVHKAAGKELTDAAARKGPIRVRSTCRGVVKRRYKFYFLTSCQSA